ncbi:MAG: hypothetical protein GX564_01195 [Oligosphaeraceae bacterium]|nr:hypothetical protein [Oligosphaeraceae bacterium]
MLHALQTSFAVVLGAGIMLLAGCSSLPTTSHIPAVTGFDAARYMGKWYEIARLPNRFERGMSKCTAEYSLRDDGKVQVVNSGLKDGKPKSASAVAIFAGEPSTGELRVSFFRPFYGSYRIIHLEPDYSVAVVTANTANYYWLLARTPTLPAADLERYLQQAAEWGFARDKIEFP